MFLSFLVSPPPYLISPQISSNKPIPHQPLHPPRIILPPLPRLCDEPPKHLVPLPPPLPARPVEVLHRLFRGGAVDDYGAAVAGVGGSGWRLRDLTLLGVDLGDLLRLGRWRGHGEGSGGGVEGGGGGGTGWQLVAIPAFYRQRVTGWDGGGGPRWRLISGPHSHR